METGHNDGTDTKMGTDMIMVMNMVSKRVSVNMVMVRDDSNEHDSNKYDDGN